MKHNTNYKLTLKKDWQFLLVSFILILLIVIVVLYGFKLIVDLDIESKLDANTDKINFYKQAVPLLCKRDSKTFSNAVIIEKKDVWSVYMDRYFKKGDELIDIVNCKRVD